MAATVTITRERDLLAINWKATPETWRAMLTHFKQQFGTQAAFDGTRKVWLLPIRHERAVQAWEKHWQASMETGSSVQPARTAHAILCLTEDAPLPLVVAAYRVLSQIHHPDHGGNHERMVEINKAYEALCQVVSKQQAT